MASADPTQARVRPRIHPFAIEALDDARLVQVSVPAKAPAGVAMH